MKKATKFSTLLILFSMISVNAQSQSTDYQPHIEGTIRGKYEYFTELDEHRFQVRNARFSVRGNLSPISLYKAEIDLSDEGKTRMLDAYVRIQPVKWWHFTIGQQKVPFSTDNLRSPHELIFANRSFMGKQLTNLRDVGLSLNIVNTDEVPFDLTVGVFNGLGLYTQDKSMKLHELSYAGRLLLFPKKPFSFQLNANTINPGAIRMTYYNAGLRYKNNGWNFEAEYLYKTYSENTLLTNDFTTGYVVHGTYSVNTPKLGAIRTITPALRYEGMTKNLKYDVQSSSSITVKSDEARSRFTGGFIISLSKPFINDIRLNYERYFWEDGTNADSKIVVEFVTKF